VGTILVAGLEALGVHGVLPEEQARAQPFGVDLELEVDLTRAGATDDLADTIDYAAVIAVTVRIVETERYQLLERLAARIAEACREDVRVTAVTVTVRKLRPPVPAALDHVGVRITA
jgi:dihydroneopterin aldolase